MDVKAALSKLEPFSEELHLDLTKPQDRFKWFLASLLFAKRISNKIALKTYQYFEEEGLTSPKKIIDAGWDHLVRVLDSGGYVRYDFSTATRLLEIMEHLKREYGDLESLHTTSIDSEDLENRLLAFKGVGPVTTNIFLRELRGIWEKADPAPSKMAVRTAQRLGIQEVKRYEAVLVRLALQYCKKSKCNECSVNEWCSEKITT